MIRIAIDVVATLILPATLRRACAQEFTGIGIAQTISDVEVVQGRLDVETTDELALLFFDEFGIVDVSPVLLDSNGNFLTFTSSLWIASNSSQLSATLVNLDTGEYVGDVAISMIGSPTPSVMTADDVRNTVNGLPPGNSPGVRVVGSEQNLDDLFNDLTQGGTESTPPTYPGIGVVLPDGTWIGIRPDSSSGGTGDTTIDIRYPDGSTTKVHIDPCSPGN
ncbi:MAG: hypothetical protein ACK49R_10285 [Planctomycetota bacterium]